MAEGMCLLQGKKNDFAFVCERLICMVRERREERERYGQKRID